MAKLTIEELIAKREQCVERQQTKYILIHSEFLGGEIEFHSLSKKELADVREQIKKDGEKGSYYFIYLSADDLRNRELLKAYNCDKLENWKVVERIFNESEAKEILAILSELNGISSASENGIYKVLVEDIKN